MNLEQRLERQNRRLKMAGLIALLAVLSVVLMGQAETVPDVIKAKRFIVVDDDGNERVLLGSTIRGYGLELFDYEGRIRMELLVDDVLDGAMDIEEYALERFLREEFKLRAAQHAAPGLVGAGFLFYDTKGEVIYVLEE